MQRRQPERPRALRTGSGRPVDPRLTGRFAPQHMPPRSTKVSEKLVLLPETETDDHDGETEKGDFKEDNELTPLRDDEDSRRPGREKAKSYAERLPKSRRAEKLARVTAYCTAQAYKMKSTAAFVKDRHGARTKLYDDCLYTAYHLPLLPGSEGYRIRSSPILKTPGGKALLDEEIERSERRDYHEGYFTEDEEAHSVRGGTNSPHGSVDRTPTPESELERTSNGHHDRSDARRDSDQSHRSLSPARIPTNAFAFAEMFVFSYGVVVFWNFSEKQEKDVLADLTFSASLATGLPSSLVTLPLLEEDFETEEFHFEYSADIPRPRVFNDMITLRSGDHMIKLAMSHAIAQSTKLSFFEEAMARQMEEAKDVPRRLALNGQLGMKREEVVKILGSLFKSRVDVNLSSNMLDVPNFFWDSEPTLHPLYSAVREYLEIKPRILVLNERCRVFLDLAEILSDSIADNKMSRKPAISCPPSFLFPPLSRPIFQKRTFTNGYHSGLTWIIIVLILLSIVVTCSEVFLRFGILSTRTKGGHKGIGACPMMVVPPMSGTELL